MNNTDFLIDVPIIGIGHPEIPTLDIYTILSDEVTWRDKPVRKWFTLNISKLNGSHKLK